MATIGPIIGRAVGAALPAGSIYLNVGHQGLSTDLDWLRRRPDVKAVFMLHDLIPQQTPQHVSQREADYFQRILGSLERADGLILNSDTAAVAVAAGLPQLSVPRLVSRLPVPPPFLAKADGQGLSGPYFIAIGQVERRKNLLLLAQVWRRLGETGAAPRLLIAGAPGDASQALARELDAWDPDRRCVALLERLTTPQLRSLLAGATALLAPSLAEGFGLPVAEALALGTPVIASDIPAHREVGGGHAVYLPPDDPEAWLAVLKPLADSGEAGAALRAKAAGYAPRTAKAYFEDIERFLATIAA